MAKVDLTIAVEVLDWKDVPPESVDPEARVDILDRIAGRVQWVIYAAAETHDIAVRVRSEVAEEC